MGLIRVQVFIGEAGEGGPDFTHVHRGRHTVAEVRALSPYSVLMFELTVLTVLACQKTCRAVHFASRSILKWYDTY